MNAIEITVAVVVTAWLLYTLIATLHLGRRMLRHDRITMKIGPGFVSSICLRVFGSFDSDSHRTKYTVFVLAYPLLLPFEIFESWKVRRAAG